MRIGLVGYGKGGRFFHAPLLASLPGASFVGVVTQDPQRRQLLAKEHPQVPAFASMAELVAAGIDVLVISTPLEGRPALVLQALELGVAVVSDKPFAADTQQAQALFAAAQQHGQALTVYQNRRWDADILTLRQLLDTNALGQVQQFESRFEVYSPHSVGKRSGGGFLRDLGSHLVDQALQLFGPVARVYAQLHYSAGHSLEHGFFIALEHVDGVSSHLHASCLQPSPGPRLRVTGTGGSYEVAPLDGQEQALLAGLSPSTEGAQWGQEPAPRWGWLIQNGQRQALPSQPGDWPQFYRHLQAALQGHEPLPVSAQQVLATTAILDAARHSAQAKQVVEVAPWAADSNI